MKYLRSAARADKILMLPVPPLRAPVEDVKFWSKVPRDEFYKKEMERELAKGTEKVRLPTWTGDHEDYQRWREH